MSDAALITLLQKQISNRGLSPLETTRATWLLEDMFLAPYRAAGTLEQGVLALLNHYADIYLTHDPLRAAKLPLFQQLIHDIQHPSNPAGDRNLINLLARSRERLTSVASPIYHKADFDPDWHTLQDIPVHPQQISQYGHLMVLPARADVCVFGDSHGDRISVEHIVNTMIRFDQQQPEDRPVLVFLGDYVNNGLNSIGLLQYVLQLQDDYPDKVILLNGNHDNRETYLTAFKEFFFVHWANYTANPYTQAPPRHYGHVLFDLLRSFGVERGENVYDAFARWGSALPYICLDQEKRLMMSHSLGKPEHITELNLHDLAYGKQADAETLARFGYEAWKQARQSSHCAMVTNRKITPELMHTFQHLGIEHFFIGHTHYLSGAVNDGRINICSSMMDSPEAGHYMYKEMVVECRMRGLTQANACYVRWNADEKEPEIHPIDTWDVRS